MDNQFFFKSIAFHIHYGHFLFHRCHSSGLVDISLFHLDLLPYSDEDVCKGDFYGAIFLVIVAVLLCCSELRTGVNSNQNNLFMAPNCVTQPVACSQIQLGNVMHCLRICVFVRPFIC